VTTPFGAALKVLFPEKGDCHELIQKEVPIGDFLDEEQIGQLHGKTQKLIRKKRVDFLLTGKNGSQLFIEFKTALAFNELSAAMIEMQLLRKFVLKQPNRRVRTASLHIFPGQRNLDAFRDLNATLGNPSITSGFCAMETE
jgi:hypothetical protein